MRMNKKVKLKIKMDPLNNTPCVYISDAATE